MDPEVKLSHRILGCELIQEAGILLKQPQVVMATGQSIFHKFYLKKSMIKYEVFSVAMGCVLLASKVEEHLKIIREVIFVFHHMFQCRRSLIRTPLELGGARYHEWKSSLLLIEKCILKELGFSLYMLMDHPHKYILYYIKLLDGSQELSQGAWNYLNDSLRLDLCVRYSSQEIACASLYLAARALQFPLPARPVMWWQLLTHSFELVECIAEEILSLYTREKVLWLEPLTPVEYLKCTADMLLKSDITVSALTPAPRDGMRREQESKDSPLREYRSRDKSRDDSRDRRGRYQRNSSSDRRYSRDDSRDSNSGQNRREHYRHDSMAKIRDRSKYYGQGENKFEDRREQYRHGSGEYKSDYRTGEMREYNNRYSRDDRREHSRDSCPSDKRRR